jgi:murein L,D-transpeptidase YcbB/YkuD
MQEIAAFGEDGLDFGDYHFKALEDLQIRIGATESPEPEQMADFDLLLSDSLIRLAYHLIFGKVDPEDFNPHWNLALEIDDRDPVVGIEDVLTSGNLAKELDDLRPPHAAYRNLKIALAAYRRIRTDGGWEPVPTGTPLKFGMAEERVSALRRRLSISGDLKDAPPSV